LGRTSLIDPDTRPPLGYTNFSGGGQKVRNLASFLTLLKFQLPAIDNVAKYPQLMIALDKYGEVGSTHS